MEILWEDEEIIVCVKPAGVLSQAGAAGEVSMITCLAEHTGGTVYPVHRLDRETGGVMVYAKTQSAAAALSRQIAAREFEKEYLALVHGKAAPEGEMRDLLFRDRTKNKSYVVTRARNGVREARLTYRLLREIPGGETPLSLVAVTLYTGRTHQIRVQFAHRQMPLLGDKKYGARDRETGLCLWSYRLCFFHPKTGERLSFCAAPQNAIKTFLGKDFHGKN